MGPYDKAKFDKGIKSLQSELPIYGRYTPLGDGIQSLIPPYNKMARKSAVILVTDGENNLGADPVTQVGALYASNPDICVHVISVAGSKEGAETIKKIAAMRKCSVVVEASDLVSSNAAVDKFVRDVFYDVVGGSTITLRSVQFAFNSAVIDGPSSAILDEVASMLKQNPRNIQIGGHTCNIGSAQYNMALSERRAGAVKAYLVKKGIPASSLTATGYGLTQPKYANNTDEGRRMNRRAELK
jgi:OOP family OmpA-OmpF porin